MLSKKFMEEQNKNVSPDQSWRNWINVVQLSWAVITALTLSLFLADIPFHFEKLVETADQRSLTELGLTAGSYASFVIGLNLTVLLAHVLIAAIIFFRRPNDLMALFVSIALVTNGALFPLSLMEVPGSIHPSTWSFLVGFITSIALVSSVILLYLFPNGEFVPRWTRWFALAWAVMILVTHIFPSARLSLYSWPTLLKVIVLLIWPGSGVYAQAYRYHFISTPVQRQQTKWAFLGLIAAVTGPFIYFLSVIVLPTLAGPDVPNLLYQRVGAPFFAFSLAFRLAGTAIISLYSLLFPLSFAIAILRYRLWDIDILIRRTLIYSVLTGLLLLIYFGSILLMQTFFLTITGEGRSEIVTMISTLAIAGLFVPLRRRVQDEIDRRFYHRKYDVAKTLAAFSESLRSEVNLDQLSDRLLTVVDETMQPEHVSLWLKQGSSVKRET